MAEKVKYQLMMPTALKAELTAYAKKYNMTTTAMCLLCIRQGLDVLKVALSTDYAKMMEVLTKEYEQRKQ